MSTKLWHTCKLHWWVNTRLTVNRVLEKNTQDNLLVVVKMKSVSFSSATFSMSSSNRY